MVKGPDAEAFVDYVITRDATLIAPMRAKYVILCNTAGGVLNDPVLLRLSADEFWFSLADSDIGMYLQGVNHDKHVLMLSLTNWMFVRCKYKAKNRWR